jgi:hypothetical protein
VLVTWDAGQDILQEYSETGRKSFMSHFLLPTKPDILLQHMHINNSDLDNPFPDIRLRTSISVSS